MSFPDIFTDITIIIYFVATLAAFIGMVPERAYWRKTGCLLALCAFCCQTIVLALGFHKFTGLSAGAYLQLLAWFILLCGIGAWWRLRQDTLLLFAAPFGLILFLMSAPSLHMAAALPSALSTPFYALHIGALFLSLGLLCIAFIAAILFLFLQKRLKAKKNMHGLWQNMPALSILDRINFACALGAFPLYTIGIVAGIFWAKPVFGSTFTGDPKEILSLFIWLLLAILFHNRLVKGWTGRKPAWLIIIIFLLSLISFLVINFFFPTHHAFIRN